MITRRRGVLKKMSVNVGPNMTPMVDIVMCILIFFMLTTSIAAPNLFLKSNTAAISKEGLGTMEGDTKLPAVRMTIKLARQAGETWVSAFDNPLMVMDKIGAGDGAHPNNDKIFEILEARRKTISDEVQVLIAPDDKVPYQDVITIYDFCVKLKFKQVAFYPAKEAG
jgi:biopolymer transport protein ExbD